MNKKTITTIAAAVVAIAAGAAETGDPIRQIEEIIRAADWTPEEIIRGLERIDNLYANDNKTSEGRIRWHGQVVRTEVDTNRMVKVVTYADGETFTNAATVVRAKAPRPPVMTNGVPAALAAARIRRQREIDQGVTNVTETVTAGGR